MSFAKTVRDIIENHPVTDPRGALRAIEKALEERKARKAAAPAKPEVIFSVELNAVGQIDVGHPGFPEAGVLADVAIGALQDFIACEGK